MADVFGVYVAAGFLTGIATFFIAIRYFVRDTHDNRVVMGARSFWAGLFWPVTLVLGVISGLIFLVVATFEKLED